MESLQFVTAQLAQDLALLLGFHAFGGDAQAFRMCDADDGLHDRHTTTGPVEGVDERAIDFDPVDLQALQPPK